MTMHRFSHPAPSAVLLALFFPALTSAGPACSKATVPISAAPEVPPVASLASAAPVTAVEADAEAPPATATGKPTISARRVEADGLWVGDFAVLSGPAPGHADGVIAALGWSQDYWLYVVAVDVASAHETTRVRIAHQDGQHITMITKAAHGIVVADQGESSLELTWVDDALAVVSHRTLAGFGVEAHRLRGFQGFDDRLLLVDRGSGVRARTTTVRVLDDHGALLSQHACQGGLHEPGDAEFGRVGDQVLLVNLNGDRDDDGRVPVCGFHLHGPARWREATLPFGYIGARSDAFYFRDGTSGTERALSEDLRLTRQEAPKEEPTKGEESETPTCTGLTGTAAWQVAAVGDAQVIHMISCCGDESPGGLFVCGPAPR
jgi:hypothetical protein